MKLVREIYSGLMRPYAGPIEAGLAHHQVFVNKIIGSPFSDPVSPDPVWFALVGFRCDLTPSEATEVASVEVLGTPGAFQLSGSVPTLGSRLAFGRLRHALGVVETMSVQPAQTPSMNGLPVWHMLSPILAPGDSLFVESSTLVPIVCNLSMDVNAVYLTHLDRHEHISQHQVTLFIVRG